MCVDRNTFQQVGENPGLFTCISIGKIKPRYMYYILILNQTMPNVVCSG